LRARLLADGGTRVGPAWATYVTENRPPQLRDLRLEPEARSVSGKLAVKWSAFDADADPVAVEVQYRAGASGSWVSGARGELPAPKPGEPIVEPEPAWREGKASWDTTTLPEGIYRIRAVGSDHGANPEGAGKETVAEWATPIFVDRTPPELRVVRTGGGGLDVEAVDALSPIARLEVLADGVVLFAPRPEDRVTDSAREVFRLSPAQAGVPGSRTLRAVDAAGNVVEAPVPAP
jgi:hypothetical protein